ncbi:MAG TPA: RNA 2'-phosphotransferase [Solirubrobacteraceae bacterium]|nr:RNA 2'-phosphotransferase [Solirubrobacteraceae bacterium]
MPRKPREDVAGAIHHVYARGNRQAALFVDDEDRERYLALLGRAVERFGWRCLSYCLMDNHVHLLLETPAANLGDGMRWLHGRFGEQLNRRHRWSGHVFQGRYGATRIKDDAHLWTAARYVALNPVEAGAVRKPEAWGWSSHAATVRGAPPPWLALGRLRELFASAGGDVLERYTRFIADRRTASVRRVSRRRAATVSKFLARHLRHSPERIGLALDEAGWAEVDEVLGAAARHGFPITRQELDAAVHAAGKRRYAYDDTGTRIRAVQGHSVAVDLGYEPRTPPVTLYHGTHAGALAEIERDGLRPMGRHHVHLSPDAATARAVGARRGPPVVLEVDAAGMHTDGHSFLLAGNGVWLTDHVPPDRLRRAGPADS